MGTNAIVAGVYRTPRSGGVDGQIPGARKRHRLFFRRRKYLPRRSARIVQPGSPVARAHHLLYRKQPVRGGDDTLRILLGKDPVRCRWGIWHAWNASRRHGPSRPARRRTRCQQSWEGGLPCYLEAQTYRYFHHAGKILGSAFGYRDKAEESEWQARDPLQLCIRQLTRWGCWTRKASGPHGKCGPMLQKRWRTARKSGQMARSLCVSLSGPNQPHGRSAGRYDPARRPIPRSRGRGVP